NIFEDPCLNFHGIQENPLKFIGIMQHGILNAESGNKSEFFVISFNNLNGTKGVSLVVSPMMYNSFDDYFAVFGSYVKKGISFVVDAVPTQTTFPLHFDEVVVYDNIPKDKIIGIICNETLAKKTIAELNLFKKTGEIYFAPIYDAVSNILKAKGIDIQPIDNEFVSLASSDINRTLQLWISFSTTIPQNCRFIQMSRN
ncbi:MAG: hypothetical protein FWF23_00240, partial [Alphaproteobacteria bacterium]|nr:hypothetical protein [Alphaproteobacteria bacterium]